MSAISAHRTRGAGGVARRLATGLVAIGSMMSDVPHTRPISVHAGSDNEGIRTALDLERSTYEGPVGILSVLTAAAEEVGIPTASLWASVPHYVAGQRKPLPAPPAWYRWPRRGSARCCNAT